MAEPLRPFSSFELWIQSVLRVPPYPQPPDGSPDSIQVFNPGRNYYKLCLLGWFLSNFLLLVILLAVYFVISRAIPKMTEWGSSSNFE